MDILLNSTMISLLLIKSLVWFPVFAAPRQSNDKYDTILGPSIDNDRLYGGFIGVGAIWQNLSQDENSESRESPGGYL